jgi:hypothetical protein
MRRGTSINYVMGKKIGVKISIFEKAGKFSDTIEFYKKI